MGPSGRNGQGLLAPRMEAEVVYRSSHSPSRRGDLSAARVGLRRSSRDAAASTAERRSASAVTPRSHPSMAARSSALAASRFAAPPPPPKRLPNQDATSRAPASARDFGGSADEATAVWAARVPTRRPVPRRPRADDHLDARRDARPDERDEGDADEDAIARAPRADIATIDTEGRDACAGDADLIRARGEQDLLRSREEERTALTVHLMSNAPNVERFAPVWIYRLHFLLTRENEKKCDTVSPCDAADAT